jgi:hypothetical protein
MTTDALAKSEAENARLRAELEAIAHETGRLPGSPLIDWQRCVDRIQDRARKALDGQ